MRRPLLALPVVLAVACSAAHVATRPDPAAEAAIRPEEARAAVEWLAAPERTGRGVGTPGNAAAAEWLAARMGEIGLAPAGVEGYQQAFEAPVSARLEGENALVLGATVPALGAGFQPFSFSDNGKVEGELVWAGHGITAPDLGHDDYAGLDVKGKVVLVAAHFPKESDPASPFRDPRAFQYGEWRYKAMNARDHGAAALLAVHDDWQHAGEEPLPSWRGIVASRAGVVLARVTAAALRDAGIDAAALARPSQSDGKPHSRPLGVPVRLAVDVEQVRARTANVLGLLTGSDPAHAGECVVVGAHYDHLGFGGEESLAPDQTGKVHPGADDNASGTAAMLAIARAFVVAGPPRRTVLFAAFSGEELGLLGSAELVKHPPAACPVEKMQLMVNLDMVGRARSGKVYVEGVASARGLRDRVAALAREAPRLPLDVAFGGDAYGPSDQTSFYAKGVPVLFFFTGAHLDYHRPTDTPDKIDAVSLANVARLAFRAARDAAQAPERLEVVHAPAPPGRGAASERAGGYGAYLGSIPDFAERAEPGVLVSAVRPGSPADQAGVRGGDIILKLGPVAIQNLHDLTFALRSHRPGDRVTLVWRHGTETRSAEVTLGERK